MTVVTRLDPPGPPARETRDGFEVVRLPVSRWPLARTVLDLARIEGAVRRLAPRPDLLLCFQTFLSGVAGVRLQGSLGIPAVVWIRHTDEYRLSSSPLARLTGPRVWATARGVLVQSEANRREMLAELGRRSASLAARVGSRLGVGPNGLELPRAPGPPGGRVLTVGRLVRGKGVGVVIDAMAGLRAGLTVAGDGPERARLEARARRLGLDARFEGFVSRARLDVLYREAACVALASRGEGLPNVVLESFAHARPVVATPVAGTADLVTDGANGLLVPHGDAAALRAALSRLTGEPALAARLGRGGREVAETFAWERVEPQLEAALGRWCRP